MPYLILALILPFLSLSADELDWWEEAKLQRIEQSLAGKVIIVTGGSSGIGESIVRSLAASGAIPVFADRSRTRGEHLSLELAEREIKHLFVHADLTDHEACQQVISETVKQFGQIDGLVNNAGFNDSIGLDATPREFRQSLEANLVHYFSMAHFALAELKKSRGAIVNVGSKVAVTGQGGTSGYAASKGGVLALTREWAAELSTHGVRVNAVVPAEVFTPQYQRWIATFDEPEAELKRINSRIPLGKRMTTSLEIANTVLFLISDLSSHTTGQWVFVDGGYTHLDRALH